LFSLPCMPSSDCTQHRFALWLLQNGDDAMDTGNSRATSRGQLEGSSRDQSHNPLPSDWNSTLPPLVKAEDDSTAAGSLQRRSGGKGRNSRAQAKVSYFLVTFSVSGSIWGCSTELIRPKIIAHRLLCIIN
jgi:hypothetical protein